MTKRIDLMTDEQLMEAVKNGELQHASILFERYHKRIFNFLARMAFDRALAEDLTQNVFMRMLKYSNSFRTGLSFQAWIYTVAKNVFYDHFRANKNKISDYVEVGNLGDWLRDENESHEQEEREQMLHRSMALLSDEQRELLILTRFQNMKYEAVAAIMNTTVSNIKVKVHRTIQKLREHYFQLEEN